MSVLDSLLEYDPPPLTNLRERLVSKQAKRVRDLYRESQVLQAERTTSLSPLEARLNAQYIELLRDADERLRYGLTTIKQQDAAETIAEQELRKLTPLQRTRMSRGYYRSGQERNAAIEGILQRERRQNAPLTRGAYDRAKAIAASRRFYDASSGSELRGSRGYSYVPSTGDLLTADADPCVEMAMRQKVRKSVLFAYGLNRGHRGGGRRRRVC